MGVSMRSTYLACAAMLAVTAAAPALAGPLDPKPIAEGVTLDPILDGRLRLETADQSNFPETATSVTVHARVGAEVKVAGFSLIAEGEFTRALVDDFNDTLPGNGVEPFPVIADPDTSELNRLSIGYAAKDFSATVGRQRIIHEDARFIGNVIWRQNEQTFDAVRAIGKLGPVEIDQTYAIGQRTIFGSKSPNQEFEGDFLFTKAAAVFDPVRIVAFRYEYDYDVRPRSDRRQADHLHCTNLGRGNGNVPSTAASIASCTRSARLWACSHARCTETSPMFNVPPQQIGEHGPVSPQATMSEVAWPRITSGCAGRTKSGCGVSGAAIRAASRIRAGSAAVGLERRGHGSGAWQSSYQCLRVSSAIAHRVTCMASGRLQQLSCAKL